MFLKILEDLRKNVVKLIPFSGEVRFTRKSGTCLRCIEGMPKLENPCGGKRFLYTFKLFIEAKICIKHVIFKILEFFHNKKYFSEKSHYRKSFFTKPILTQTFLQPNTYQKAIIAISNKKDSFVIL